MRVSTALVSRLMSTSLGKRAMTGVLYMVDSDRVRIRSLNSPMRHLANEPCQQIPMSRGCLLHNRSRIAQPSLCMVRKWVRLCLANNRLNRCYTCLNAKNHRLRPATYINMASEIKPPHNRHLRLNVDPQSLTLKPKLF